VLASLSERGAHRQRARRRGFDDLLAQERRTPPTEGEDIPVLHDVVQPEELQRAPAEPPLLTDEVVPGRPQRG
jgi:hypothetical protein